MLYIIEHHYRDHASCTTQETVGTNKSVPVDVNFINSVAVLLTLNPPKEIATKSYSSNFFHLLVVNDNQI
jgi:hypothetical protein